MIQVHRRPKFILSERGSFRDVFLGIGLQINEASKCNIPIVQVLLSHSGDGKRLYGVS